MKGLGGGRRRQQGDSQSPATTPPHIGPQRSNNTVVSSRQVTLQDILDLTTYSGSPGIHTGSDDSSVLDATSGGLDFESSRVIVVNTGKGGGGKRGARKRALSVSPRLDARGAAVGSCGSVAGTGGTGGVRSGGGFYTWMQCSLRRTLRKRPKKSTLPRSQTPPPPACHCTHHDHQRRNQQHQHQPQQPGITQLNLEEAIGVGVGVEQEVESPSVLASPEVAPCPAPSSSPTTTSYAPSSTPSSTPSSSPTPSCTCPSSTPYTTSFTSPPSPTKQPNTPSSSSPPPQHAVCASTSTGPTPYSSPLLVPACSCRHPTTTGATTTTTTTTTTASNQQRVTYVNHRNGSVTAVSAATVLQALTSGSPGAKPGKGGGGGRRGVSVLAVPGHGGLSHTTRGRSTSASRRVILSTALSAAAVVVAASGGGKKGNNSSSSTTSKKVRKHHRVFGGAWGLFHCAGAGARSRSCTPERNVNFRVRSRSATPERYMNVRVNNSNSGGGNSSARPESGAGRKAGSMKLVKTRRKSKSSRRRFSAESDEEANKENKYDMWGFIRDRLEGSGSGGRRGSGGRGGRPCAAERLSRRDTLPCGPRGSVNINRGDQRASAEFSTPDVDLPLVLTTMARSVSEKRYDPRAMHAPPTDMCTYIHRVPPTTDVNFNNYGSVLSMQLKKGDTLPLMNLQKCVAGTSVASSLNSVGSKDSGVSSSSSSCGGITTAYGTSRGLVPHTGTWADVGRTAPRERTNTLPVRYQNRPLPPIPKPQLPPKPPESGIHLVKTLKLEKFMKNKWISGISVTRKNDLVVVDLKEMYLIDEDGILKRTIGTCGKGALKEPIDVTCMANGNVAVSDHADQEVKVFTTKGQFVRRIMNKCLANIAGVATDNRRVFIAGTDKRCVTVHSEEEGCYLYSIPSKETTSSSSACSNTTSSGSLKELFEHPYSIAVNPLTGDVIVGDDYKQRVVALSPDGRILWRYSPTGDRHFFPCSIAVDSEGYIFIADLYNEKIYMLDSSGKHLKVLLSRGDGLKGAPGAIAVDGRGNLVVADEERTLKVFKYGDNGFALYRRFSMCPDAK